MTESRTPRLDLAADSPRAAWRRIRRMGKPRATKANALGALLALILGFALVAQVQSTTDRSLTGLRQDELIRVLDQVSTRADSLDLEVRRLQATRDALKLGAGSSADALAAARKRLDTLGLLAGTVAASGPGIVVSVSDRQRGVTAAALLDAVQELRDAGAEVIDIGGVRVVASTAFTGEPGALQVDGTTLARTFDITAIGDARTMATAMDIPGGVLANLTHLGAVASVRQESALRVTSLHTPKSARYAQPVPAPGDH